MKIKALRTIVMPNGRLLAAGAELDTESTPFLRRRIAAGDFVEEPAAAAAAARKDKP